MMRRSLALRASSASGVARSINEDDRANTVVRLAPELEGEVPAHRDSDRNEGAFKELKHVFGPSSEVVLWLSR